MEFLREPPQGFRGQNGAFLEAEFQAVFDQPDMDRLTIAGGVTQSCHIKKPSSRFRHSAATIFEFRR